MPSALPALALVWIDDYHLGDPLFVQAMGRGLSSRDPEVRRAVLVHGAAERAARLLESSAMRAEIRDGVPHVETTEARGMIERAYREANKDVVAVLTEFGVPAVGIQGADRRLLRLEEGTVRAPGAGWMETMTASGAVAVVSALADRGGIVDAVPTGEAVSALATSLTGFEPEVRIFQGDRRKAAEIPERDRLSYLSGSMPEADYSAVKSLVSAGFPLFLCDSRTVFDPDPASRTPIFG